MPLLGTGRGLTGTMKQLIFKSVMAVLVALFSFNAHAYVATINGICYDIDTSNMTASVTYGNNKYTGSLIIPSTFSYDGNTYSVTSIGNRAFMSCSDLTSIEIPNSVTSIGNSAFDLCTGLNSLTIPNSVTSIDDYAFYRCNNLTSVIIPNSVTSIGRYAFINTPWYNNQPDGMVYINNVAYKYKGTMPQNTDLIIRDGTISISGSAFQDYTNLTSVTIPNSVTSIGNMAFSGCSGLSNITIPNSVTSIGDAAFADCSGLTTVTIGNSVTSIGLNAFMDCSGLTTVTIGNSVTNIGKQAFYGCNALMAVHIIDLSAWCSICFEDRSSNPLTLNRIYNYLYLNGEKVTDLIIPSGVTSIGNYAFCQYDKLTSVTIPNSVTSIGDEAFNGCNLTSIFSEIEEPFTFGHYAFYNYYSYSKLTVPYGTKDAYIAAGWTEDGFRGGIVEAPVKNIEFADANVKAICVANWDTNNDGELSYTEAAAVTNFGTVFKNNTQITSFDELQYFTGLTSIGYQAFNSCSSLTSVTIPNSVTSIGNYAFSGCRGLTSLTIPNSVTSIGDWAFDGCRGLTSVSLPNSITTIGEYAFGHCI